MAAQLQHDAQGFLTGGEPINTRDLVDTWGSIARDVSDIRRLLMRQAQGNGGGRSRSAGMPDRAPGVGASSRANRGEAANDASKRRTAVQPSRPRDESGRFIAAERMGADAANRGTRRNGASQPAQNAQPVNPATRNKASAANAEPSRDSSGRFQKGDRADVDGDSPGARNILAGSASRIVEAIKSAGGNDELDPGIKAMNEVAQPLARTYQAILGGGDAKDRVHVRWYRRLFGELRGARKEDKEANKKQITVLTAIDEKTVKGGGSGGGLLSGLLGRLGIPALAGGAGLMGKLARGAGGLLRRIPVLGGLIAGGSAAWSMFGGDDDPNASSEENRARRYRNTGQAAGMGVGGILGGVLGSALGPLGTVGGAWLGSLIGEKVGAKVGEWTRSLVDADIPAKIHASWETATAYMGMAWDSLVTDAKASWSALTVKAGEWWESAKGVAEQVGTTVATAGAAVNDWAQDKLGVDVAAKAGQAWDATKNAAESAWDATKNAASSAWGATKDFVTDNGPKLVPETVKRAAEAGSAAATQAKAGYQEARGLPVTAPAPVSSLQSGARKAGGAAGAAANWVLGKTSEKYESGGKGAGTVSSGKGDHGGASYGTYQLASKTGTLAKFLKSNPQYGSQLSGLTPGTPEFNAKWKQIAKDDPAFGAAQHKFIEDTHYKPQMAKLQRSGIDLSGRGAAVQDAVWSTSVQFGGETGLIGKALQGRDANSLSDAEVISAIQDYKIARNESLFKSSSADQRAGTAKRAISEKQSLLALSAADPMRASAAVSVAPPPPVTLARATPAAAAPAPEVPRPISTVGAGRGAVSPPVADPGQDMSDRRLSHIATGGISGG